MMRFFFATAGKNHNNCKESQEPFLIKNVISLPRPLLFFGTLSNQTYYDDKAQDKHDSAQINCNRSIQYRHSFPPLFSFLREPLPFLAGMGQPPDNIEKQSQSHGNTNLKH
jgi:hypothetical protein